MTLAKLILILCTIESSDNPSAIGDGGSAIGVLQIHAIMVRECNRLIGKEAFHPNDRLDPIKSRAMADVFLRRRVQNVNLLTSKEIEDCVKSWNGGPSWKRGSDKKIENVGKYYQRFIAEASRW